MSLELFLRRELKIDPIFAEYAKELPPHVLILSGVERRINRELSIEMALKFLSRKFPIAFFTFRGGSIVSASFLERVLTEFVQDWQTSLDLGEAGVYMYGRRNSVLGDNRTIVAYITH